jgi:phage gpG-like protein
MSKAGKAQFTLDLESIFGEFPDDETLRLSIGQRAIELIRERTEQGLDKNGRPFAPYSDAYKDSLAFRAHGKSDGEVNMTLSGDMLGLLDIIEEGTTKLTFGWEDELENAKAWNHTTGDTVPKRDFLGLTNDDINKLYDEFKEDVEASRLAEQEDVDIRSDEEIEALELLRIIEGRDV